MFEPKEDRSISDSKKE